MTQSLNDQILNYLQDCYTQNVNTVVTATQIGAHLGIRGLYIRSLLRNLKQNGFVALFNTNAGETGYRITFKGLNKNKPTSSESKRNYEEVQNHPDEHISKNIDDEIQIKKDIKFYISELKTCVSSSEYYKGMDVVGHMIEYLEKISLPKSTLDKLNSKLNTLWMVESGWLDMDWLKDGQKYEPVDEAYESLFAYLEFLLKNPTPLKFKTYKKIKSREKPKDGLFRNISTFFKNSKTVEEKSLELPVSHEDPTGKIKVFISHKFVESDQKLAETLRMSLKEHNIYGYNAKREKEFDVVFEEKIKQQIASSDYLVAIITKKSLLAPSVNQEIGCAKGAEVKVRILVEENEAKGVFVEGKDMITFSRDSFEKSLESVIKDIQKNGFRKKPDDKLLEALNEHVYVPCYNQMINVYQNMDFIDNVPENPWKNIPANWKLNTEDDIKQLFIQYTEICDEWEKLRSDFIQNFSERKSKLIPIIVSAFRKCKLLDKNNHIILDDTTIEPHYWLEAFRMVLFDWNVTSGEELYQSLYNYAKNSKNGHDKWIKQWWDSNNGVHSNLFEIIPELIDVLDSPISQKMLDEKRTELRESIIQLTLALENKTKII